MGTDGAGMGERLFHGDDRKPGRKMLMSGMQRWRPWPRRDGGGCGDEFWRETFAWAGSATPHVLPRVAAFGLISAALTAVSGTSVTWPVGPHEVAGAVLGLFLVLRTVRENYGHLDGDRLLSAAVRENVLVQVGRLRNLPAVASRLARGDLRVHAWVYKIDSGEIFAFDGDLKQFLPIHSGRHIRSALSGPWRPHAEGDRQGTP